MEVTCSNCFHSLFLECTFFIFYSSHCFDFMSLLLLFLFSISPPTVLPHSTCFSYSHSRQFDLSQQFLSLHPTHAVYFSYSQHRTVSFFFFFLLLLFCWFFCCHVSCTCLNKLMTCPSKQTSGTPQSNEPLELLLSPLDFCS